MILSGPKSYYDDFVRKKDTSRTLHDPPSLLTDRGAYMNFLEVQLERVSAACLGVQSYDDRFNDMQTLIVSLDKKCAATARMLSISQQCTEQLRTDTEAKIEKIAQDFRTESWEIKRLIEVMSTRIAAVEHKAAELPGIHKRLDDDNTRTVAIIQEIQQLSEKSDSKMHIMDCQMKDFEAFQQATIHDVEGLKTADSKLQFDLTESERKYQNLLEKSASENSQHIAESEDKMARNIHIAEIKMAGNMETLQVDMASKEAGCLAAVRLLGESLREETFKIKEKLENHLAGMEEELNTSVENQMKRVNRSLSDQVDVINEEIESQRKKISTLHENNRVQFKQFDRTLESLAKDQEELFNLTNSMNNTSLMGTTGRLYGGEGEVSNHSHSHSHSHHQREQTQEEEREEEPFCLNRAAAARAAKRGAEEQTRDLQGISEQREQSQPRIQSHSTRQLQHQGQQDQQQNHIPSTPSLSDSRLMTSVHDLDEEDSSGLKYIGSGLYVDGHRPTSPNRLYSDSTRAESPLEAIRDANNDVVSEIKPNRQHSAARLSERGEQKSTSRPTDGGIQQSSTKDRGMMKEQTHTLRGSGAVPQQPGGFEATGEHQCRQQGQQQDRQQINQQSQLHSNQQGHLQSAQQSYQQHVALSPPPPLPPVATVPSPKRRRAPPPRSQSQGQGQSQAVGSTQESHKVLQRANTTTVVNSSISTMSQNNPEVLLAPVTTGFMQFLKKKEISRQNSLVSFEGGESSESTWKEVLGEERPPWLPSGATTTTSSIRKVDSQKNVLKQHQQQQQHTTANVNNNSDDRTAASTISEMHSHTHAFASDQDKMLPERRHYVNSGHLKGASAHLKVT